MRSSWNHATDHLWRRLDPVLWELTRNPWVVLQTVSRAVVRQALEDAAFRKNVEDLLHARQQSAQASAWFEQTHPASALQCVAYFSMEFMLGEALPIYSGGLGNVAGDQLKAASDLGVPVVGVGLLYQQGYFRQTIDRDGAQQALYPYNEPGQLPIAPLRDPDGEWLRLEIALPGYSVWLRAWEVQVGRVRLYLLDSNDAANFPAHRGITSELYGGGPQTRLKQEIVLGIGGWRLLAAIGVEPQVCHLNEGHAAFAVLERARGCMQATGLDFDAALAVTRAGNLFTTHTAVAAGFDRFAPALIEQYLGEYAERSLGIPLDALLALGRQDPNDAAEPFNMAYLAIRGSAAVNGVSRLHASVSRQLFAPLFPRWPVDEIPVTHVTNGVHVPTWDSVAADELWTEACHKDRWLGPTETLHKDIRCLPDEQMWRLRNACRSQLVGFVRQRLARQLAASGAPADTVQAARHIFDADTLTIGFARRFASYKRPNLLLHDRERLLRLLSSNERPVQLVIAGKAHPADEQGQALIRQWMHFIGRSDVRAHVVFLSDQDMQLSEQLVQGVDLWLNTPRRPWEACGTSGMKVLVNGGLNLSELDGWWAEAYAPDVGWALGDGQQHADESAWDAIEADALYALLESEVAPSFYQRNDEGIPGDWVARMRESMARLTPQFSSNRAVREYTETHYLPAAAAYAARTADNGAGGVELAAWRQALDQAWPRLRFGELKLDSSGDAHRFEVQLYLDQIDPPSVRVELFANALDGGMPVREPMQRLQPLDGTPGGWAYVATVPAQRPASDYTVRALPHHDGVALPLEDTRILWQR
ncbi:MAG: alpha-glucan family phosphorylase [Burkholderiaceae bacterium]|jgi:starch phosphorylase|nr:alpha-glucan family phosphorylase [Burkholderiaceae bacterium]